MTTTRAAFGLWVRGERGGRGAAGIVAAGVVGVMGGLAPAALADVTFTGTGGGFGSAGAKAASVGFGVSGTDLVVTLTNTATSDVLVPADVLTAVFFDVGGSGLALTRTSALLTNGSAVFYGGGLQPTNGVVGGEWAYKSGLAGAPKNGAYGISATGLGLFGPQDLFPGPDLSSPASPAGVDYGLLSAGDNPATGNGGITGSGGIIKNSVTFTLSGLPANFDLNLIGNVFFLYGSAIGEGGFSGLPSPGALAVFGAAGVVAARRRR